MLWSWMLAAVGIAGLVLAGRRKAVGWAIGLGAQVLWVAYAVATHQWGFIISALAYAAVYAKNWLTWSNVLVTVGTTGKVSRLTRWPLFIGPMHAGTTPRGWWSCWCPVGINAEPLTVRSYLALWHRARGAHVSVLGGYGIYLAFARRT